MGREDQGSGLPVPTQLADQGRRALPAEGAPVASPSERGLSSSGEKTASKRQGRALVTTPSQARPRLLSPVPPDSSRERLTARHSVFSPRLELFELRPLERTGEELGLADTLMVIQRWREALLSLSNGLPEKLRETLSGHTPEGRPLEGPHLALFPLAAVGFPSSGGRLLGLGAALPDGLAPEERRRLVQLLERVEELLLGPRGAWRVTGRREAPPRGPLRSAAWTLHPHGATRWSTVTPIVFDRHSKAKTPLARRLEEEESLVAGCQAIGLPAPRQALVTPVSAHLGVPPAHLFPFLRRKDGSPRRHAHAILVFDEPVTGPVLLGAGRYRGYGLCKPMDTEGS